jgi:hypothetical protein
LAVPHRNQQLMSLQSVHLHQPCDVAPTLGRPRYQLHSNNAAAGSTLARLELRAHAIHALQWPLEAEDRASVRLRCRSDWNIGRQLPPGSGCALPCAEGSRATSRCVHAQATLDVQQCASPAACEVRAQSCCGEPLATEALQARVSSSIPSRQQD